MNSKHSKQQLADARDLISLMKSDLDTTCSIEALLQLLITKEIISYDEFRSMLQHIKDVEYKLLYERVETLEAFLNSAEAYHCNPSTATKSSYYEMLKQLGRR